MLNSTVLLEKTILWPLHQKLGAKFTDFAGVSMPVDYGSQIEEHQAVRQDAGAFDVSHMAVIDIAGTDSEKFLSYIITNDIKKTKANTAIYSCMCNSSGGIIDDLIIYNLGPNFYRMVVNAGTWRKDLNWLEQHKKNFNVSIRKYDDLAIIAVQGPKAREKIIKLLPANLQDQAEKLKPFECTNGHWFVARTGYTGEDGFEIILPNDEIVNFWQKITQNNIKACGLGARDTLRLEAGMSLYGADMDETTLPFDSGLGWTVDLSSNRDFIGRDVLESQKNNRKTAAVKTEMIGLILEGRGVLRAGQKVMMSGINIGTITSGTFSPTLGQGIAMARVNINSDLHLKDLKNCSILIRDKQHQAKIVKYPFVRFNEVVFKSF